MAWKGTDYRTGKCLGGDSRIQPRNVESSGSEDRKEEKDTQKPAVNPPNYSFQLTFLHPVQKKPQETSSNTMKKFRYTVE